MVPGRLLALALSAVLVALPAPADAHDLTLTGGRRLISRYVHRQARHTLSAFAGYQPVVSRVGTCGAYRNVDGPGTTAVICRALLLADDESGHPQFGADGWIFNMSAMALRRPSGRIELHGFVDCAFDFSLDRWHDSDEPSVFRRSRRWLDARRLTGRCYR